MGFKVSVIKIIWKILLIKKILLWIILSQSFEIFIFVLIYFWNFIIFPKFSPKKLPRCKNLST